MTYAGEQNLKCSQEQQFCSFFYTFEIKEGTNKDYMEVEEERWGLDYWIVNKIICSPKCGYSLFQRCVNLIIPQSGVSVGLFLLVIIYYDSFFQIITESL